MQKRQTLLLVFLIAVPMLIGTTLAILDRSGIDIGDPLSKKIALVRLEGEITESEEIVRQLKEYREDNTVAGLLLRIDSPGGAVSPSQEIYAEVLKYRDLKKPVVVTMGNLAASGGYYVASAGNTLFANPGTITGSIGVIMQFPQYYKLLEKVGVNFTTVKAGHFKDVGNPNRPLNTDDLKLLQDGIDDTHEQFIADVAYARNYPIDSLRVLADGRIFNGTQALAVGLIDTLGGFEAAKEYIRLTCKLDEDAPIIEDIPPESFMERMMTNSISRIFPMIKKLKAPSGVYAIMENF